MFAWRSLTQDLVGQHVMQKDVEKNYHLLGITGVEDLLQDNVPECVQEFRDAGINVLMLTGDKGATAKSLATQALMLGPNTKVYKMSENDDLGEQLQAINTKAK